MRPIWVAVAGCIGRSAKQWGETMGFRLPDRFLWDFWTIEAHGLTWLYALTAPRDADAETRHDRARIDVMTSADLHLWHWRGVALQPGPAGAWDDLALWTGSVAAMPGGGYAMLYTGRSRAEGGRVQRIGLATSDDLLAWTKHGPPVIEADPRWYRERGRDGTTAWRDPWLAWNAETGLWEAWITAQRREGDVMTSGTVAHAASRDLLGWEVAPPVVVERLSEHLEVPQVVQGGAGLLVNVYPQHVAPCGPLPRACLSLHYRRDGGAFRFRRVVESWPTDSRYVVKEVRPGLGLCWRGRQPDGTFLGEISDPFALVLDGDAGDAP